MDNFIQFTDSFNIILNQDVEETKKQDFLHLLFPTTSRRYRAKSEDDMTTPRVLGVRIAATHSGKVTENNGFYLPDRMKTGTSSWLEPFPKPILLHHDKQDDAVGRVKNAKYVDISEGFRKEDGWIKRADKIVGDMPSDRLIDAFINGELNPRDAVDVVRNVFLVQDFNYTKNASYPGLGYIELAAAISDPDTIRKVLDERFMTGSIGARSDSAVCSVCKKDWVKDGFCDHKPGKEYENILCVMIAGNLLYDEYSYVNRPADQQSRNLEIFSDGEMKDSLSLESGSDKLPEVWFNFDDSITEFAKPEKDIQMDKETLLKLLDFVKPPEGTTLEQIVDSLLKEKFQFSAEDLTDAQKKTELAKAVEKAIGQFASSQDKEVLKQDQTTKKQEEKDELLDVLKQELGADYVDLVGENPDESDILYAQQIADVKMDRVEDLSAEEKQLILDAKLSSSSRKKLASSTFCGPDRSFPVPDCAHVTAARRLIGRYKGPGSKSSILACVSRKAKRLGCDDAGKKKDEIGIYTPEYFDTFEDSQLLQLINGVYKAASERKLIDDMITPTGVKLYTPEEAKKLGIVDTGELKAENEKLIEKLNAANADSETLQKELADAYKDLELAREQLVDSQKQNRHIRASHIVAYQVLAGTAIEDTSAKVEELMAKTDEELTVLEDEVRGSVDVTRINTMLQNGLANEPQEGVVVDDPTLGYTEEDKTKQEQKIEDEKQKDLEKPKLTKEFMENIKRQFIEIRCIHGAPAANQFLDSLKAQGIIPTEMPTPKDEG